MGLVAREEDFSYPTTMSSSDTEKPLNWPPNKESPEEATERTPSPLPEEITWFQEACFVFLICLCQIMTQAGVAQTVNLSTEIGSEYGVASLPGEISWFTASYSLTVGTFILVAGRLGDLYGYKFIFTLGFAIFGLWSLIAGFAGFTNSRIFFNVARALQGIGPAFSMPNAAALLGHYFPMGKKRMIYMALFGAVAPLGFFFGALFSGIFGQLVWWPWTFWVAAMVCALIVVMSYLAIPRNIGNISNGCFDWWGSISGVSGLVLINFAWNQGPNIGWDHVYVYVLLIVGFLCLGAFVVASKYAAEPLVPMACLRGETGFVLGCIACGWACFGVWLYYTFRWAEVVDGDKALVRGAQFGPSPIAGFCAGVLTVILLRKTSSAVVMLVAMLAFFVGITIMGTRHEHQIYWGQKFVSLCIQSFGMDMSFPAGTMILSAVLPKRQQGLAGSLVSTFVNYSISIGLGIAGTVEKYTTEGMPEGYEKTVKGIRNAFYMGIGIAGLGVTLATIFLFVQVFGRQKKVEFDSDHDSKSPSKAPSLDV